MKIISEESSSGGNNTWSYLVTKLLFQRNFAEIYLLKYLDTTERAMWSVLCRYTHISQRISSGSFWMPFSWFFETLKYFLYFTTLIQNFLYLRFNFSQLGIPIFHNFWNHYNWFLSPWKLFHCPRIQSFKHMNSKAHAFYTSFPSKLHTCKYRIYHTWYRIWQINKQFNEIFSWTNSKRIIIPDNRICRKHFTRKQKRRLCRKCTYNFCLPSIFVIVPYKLA